jgi:very-short-patch-repair endonuclease
VVIELDGYGNHRTRAQLNRDHQRDLELRAAGYIVVRYTETQIMDHPDEVAQDVMRLLGINLPVPSAARGSR